MLGCWEDKWILLGMAEVEVEIVVKVGFRMGLKRLLTFTAYVLARTLNQFVFLCETHYLQELRGS